MLGDIKVTFTYTDGTNSPITLPQGLGCFSMGTVGERFRYGIAFKCKVQDKVEFAQYLGGVLLDTYLNNKDKLVEKVLVQSYENEDGTYASERTYEIEPASKYVYEYNDGEIMMDNGCSVCNESLFVVSD